MTRARSSTGRGARRSGAGSADSAATASPTPSGQEPSPLPGNARTSRDTPRVPSVDGPAPVRDSGHTRERTLGKTERRYIAKAEEVGRRTLWGVYDRQRGSWPVQLAGFGRVKQDLDTEEEAQAEADRLEATR